MKRKFFKCMAFLALATSVGLTSCSKEDPAKAVDFNNLALEKGSIEGIAFANYDKSSDEPQYAPSGTAIFLTVSYDALGIENADNGETVQLQTTVGANGAFVFTNVPLNRYKATIVKVSGQPFVKGYTYQDGWEDGKPVYATKKYTFTTSPSLTDLQPGGKNFVTITYDHAELFQ